MRQKITKEMTFNEIIKMARLKGSVLTVIGETEQLPSLLREVGFLPEVAYSCKA